MLDLTKFYSQNAFKFNKDLAYGVYRMRLISILTKGNYVKVTISFSKQISREEGSTLSTKMKEFRLENRALQRAIVTNFYMELFIYNSASIQQEFFPVLEKTLDILNTLNIETCETCPLCGHSLSTNSPFIRIAERAIQAHDICIEQIMSTTNNIENEMNLRAKKTLGKSLLVISTVALVITGLFILFSFLGAYSFIAFLAGYLSFAVSKLILMRVKIPYMKAQTIINIITSSLALLITTLLGSVFCGAELFNKTFIEVISDYFYLLNVENYLLLKNVLIVLGLGIILLGLIIFGDIKRFADKKNRIIKL